MFIYKERDIEKRFLNLLLFLCNRKWKKLIVRKNIDPFLNDHLQITLNSILIKLFRVIGLKYWKRKIKIKEEKRNEQVYKRYIIISCIRIYKFNMLQDHKLIVSALVRIFLFRSKLMNYIKF